MGNIHELYELYRASNKQNTAIFEFLKDPANKESVKDTNNADETVLDLAYENDDYSLVERLLETDAYQNLPAIHKHYLLYKTSANQNKKILDFLKDSTNNAFIEDLNSDEKTVLHLAAYDDEWELVYLLMELGADVIKRDKDKRTPLSYCLNCRYTDKLNIPLIQLFIARGANINEVDERGFTSLHYAVLAGDAIKVNTLMSLGADIDQINNTHETPLKMAFRLNIPNKNIVLKILFKNSDIISQDFTDIVPAAGLTDGVIVSGSTILDAVLRKRVPITRATPGFENAITNAEEFRQAAEADETEFNELSKTEVTAKRRYNYKAIEIITKNKKTPEMQALHTAAAEFEKRTEPRTKSLKEVPAHLLAKQCIFSKFDARIKLEQDLAKAPPDLQDLIAKEIHAIAVAKSSKYQ